MLNILSIPFKQLKYFFKKYCHRLIIEPISSLPIKDTPLYRFSNKLNLIKLISLCTAKETINRTRRQLTEWEKIPATDATDMGLLFKADKQLTTQSSKNNNNKQIKKCAEDLDISPKGDIYMANRHVKKTLLFKCISTLPTSFPPFLLLVFPFSLSFSFAFFFLCSLSLSPSLVLDHATYIAPKLDLLT